MADTLGLAQGQQGKHYHANKKKKLRKREKEKQTLTAASTRKIDAATLDYWKRVETTVDEDAFEDEEEKSLFVGNVLSVLDGQEIKLSKDQGQYDKKNGFAVIYMRWSY